MVRGGDREVGVADVEFLGGELGTRRGWLSGGGWRAVRSALEEHRQPVPAGAPARCWRRQRDPKDLSGGAGGDVRWRRCRTAARGVGFDGHGQLKSVVSPEHAGMARSVHEREPDREAGACGAGRREHGGVRLLGSRALRRSRRRGGARSGGDRRRGPSSSGPGRAGTDGAWTDRPGARHATASRQQRSEDHRARRRSHLEHGSSFPGDQPTPAVIVRGVAIGQVDRADVRRRRAVADAGLSAEPAPRACSWTSGTRSRRLPALLTSTLRASPRACSG